MEINVSYLHFGYISGIGGRAYQRKVFPCEEYLAQQKILIALLLLLLNIMILSPLLSLLPIAALAYLHLFHFSRLCMEILVENKLVALTVVWF
jgi:hypothetical protein